MIASLFKKQHRFSFSRALGVTIALVGLLAQGCIGDDENVGGDGTDPDIVQTEGQGPSIKVYVKDANDEYQLVELRPQAAPEKSSVDAPDENDPQGSRSARGGDRPSERSIAKVDAEWGGTDYELGGVFKSTMQLDHLPLWAADACMAEASQYGTDLGLNPPLPKPFSTDRSKSSQNPGQSNSARFRWAYISFGVTGGSPWDAVNASYYNIAGNWDTRNGDVMTDGGKFIKSCDHVLFMQSQLLCSAEKLMSIADAVGTVQLTPTVLVPPQATEDRHLVLRLAMENLAAIAQLDQETVIGGLRCPLYYSTSLSSPTTYSGTTHNPRIFNAGAAPLLGLTVIASGAVQGTFNSGIKERVRLWVEHHRAALLMFKDVVDRLGNDGLAAAEALRAEGGLARMWGSDPTKLEEVDNSLRAVVARQIGRLEVDSFANNTAPVPTGTQVSAYMPRGEPECMFLPSVADFGGESDIILSGFKAGLGARAADRPPNSLGQQRAQALVERVGMILPHVNLKIQLQIEGALLTMLREQLVRHDAKVVGIDWATEVAEFNDFEDQRAAAYDSLLDGLTDADVAFGVTSASSILAQLGETELWPIEGHLINGGRGVYGISSMEGPTLDLAGGSVFSIDPAFPTGLSKSYLAYSIDGTASRSAAMARCTGSSPTDGVKNAQEIYQSPADAAYALHYNLSSIFPDPASFSLKAWDPAVARRFELTRTEYATTHAVGGLVRVEVWHEAAVMSDPDEWRVSLIGIVPTPAAGASNPLDDMDIGLIYGRPWEADCLAGVRKACGPSFAPAKPLAFRFDTMALRDAVGQYKKDWYFNNATGITYRTDTNSYQSDAMMVVLLPKEGRPGRVLGTIKPRASPTNRPEVFALSAQSAAFVDKVFSGAVPQEGGDRCIESAATGLPAASCIAGMYRDQYIPLTNELNSDGTGGDDSWKHYLSLAKEAATHADQLGQQLMDVGLSRELRMEGAQEALASLCGEIVDVAQTDFTDGTGKSLDSGELNSCLAQDTVDFVFFNGKPAPSNAEAVQLIREAGVCKPDANPPFPFCTAGGEPAIASDASVASFEFPAAPGPERSKGIPGCDKILGTNPGEPDPEEILVGGVALDQALAFRWFGQSTFDLDRWALASGSSAFDPVTLAAAVMKLQFEEDNMGVWRLTLNGAPLLAGFSGLSAPTAGTIPDDLEGVWPLCRELDPTGKGEPVPEEDDGCSLQARRIERSFTAHVPTTQLPVNVEYDAKIRRSVEGALWAMARLTGYMPSGLFTKVLPAMNFSSSTAEAEAEAPAPAIFAPGTFQNSSGSYTLSGGYYDSDRRKLGTLVPMSDALTRWWRERVSPTQTYYQSYFANEASENNDHYLGVLATNKGRAFYDQLPSHERNYYYDPTQTYTLNDWLEAVLRSASDYDKAWLAMRWSLLNGLQPKSLEFLMNGRLLSHVAMRIDMCDPALQHGTFADLFPSMPPGAQPQDLLHMWPSIGDSHPQFWTGSTFGTPPEIWNGEDGYFNEGGVLYSDRTSPPDCGVAGIGTSCSGGTRYWRPTTGQRHHAGVGFENCGVVDSEFTADLLSPQWWPPSERVQHFIDPGPDAYSVLAMMGTLACLAPQDGLATISEEVPEVTSPKDVAVVRNWIDLQAMAVARYQETLFLIDVPEGVVASVKAGRVDYAQLGQGEKGSQSLAVAEAVLSTYHGFSAVYDGLRRASAALKNAELVLAQIDVQEQVALNDLSITQTRTIANAVMDTIQIVSQAAASIISFIPLPGMFNPGGGAASAGNAASAAVDLVAQLAILEKVNENAQLTGELYALSTGLTLSTMSDEAAAALNQVNGGLKQIQTGQLEAVRAQIALAGVQREAAFALAKASGADSVDLNGDGEADYDLPVNTVYRRSYDVLSRRYRDALETAKRYAYMARLSMEQKLGVRFASLNESIGSVPPPSQWIDRLCEMTGIDYEALRTVEGGTSAEEEFLGEFADQYVGDYVTQLEALLEFYNIQYPSQVEGDEAVLSLRDDLVYGDGVCQRDSSNLLYFSDELGSNNSRIGDDPFGPSSSGWRTTGCTWDSQSDSGVCLEPVEAIQRPDGSWGVPYEVTPVLGATQSELAYVTPPTPRGGATILRNYVTEEEPRSALLNPAPEASVYQTVELEGGDTYILSWVDMARAGAGGIASAMAPVQYRVMVTTEDWKPLLIDDPVAEGGDDVTWSERRQLTITPVETGNYNVVFMPSPLLELDAVAIANVQLEAATGVVPGPYEATTASRVNAVSSCGRGNPQMLRDAFVRRCEGDSCFYELTKPIQLVEGKFAAGKEDLPGVAANNFNYRHGSVVLNVVGSGVLDCTNADASCFSQGFLEYDLVHSAFNAELVDHAGEPRCFNFGGGTINHGKALAAERVLGVPLSPTDSEFIGSSAFQQQALVGRPLSGRYNLRIYETPELRWEQIEDIQLYLDYSYWSRVDTQQ